MSEVLKDKVAVVTGGNSGIGLAIARRFVGDGARVFITGRRQAELDAAVAGIGVGVEAVRCDVGRLADLDALYRPVQERAGQIDVLVANAGSAVIAPFGEVTEEQFDVTVATNLKGVFFSLQKAAPLLAPGASVIVIGSSTSVRPDVGMSVYSATKAALRSVVRSAVMEYKGDGFRFNMLSPGPTKTPGLVGLVPEDQQDAFLEQMASGVPLGRVGNPDEIANAALFLATDAASFVDGVELFVDGGFVQV